MEEQFDHGACVHAWLERTTRVLPPGQLPLAFEQALNAVWKRAERILGDMTLTAIYYFSTSQGGLRLGQRVDVARSQLAQHPEQD
jgi:hypothetical protein